MFANFESINIGDERSIVRKIKEEDVRKFVEFTGDDNPLHVNRSFAEQTAFKDVVVHGMLGASFLSTVIGTKLPGAGALWVSQNIDFLLPVRLDDELKITCVVIRKHERDRLLELETRIVNQHGQLVLSGQGKVKLLESKSPKQPGINCDAPKVALITGGGGGIGQAICLRLAKDGYSVAVNYLGRRDKADRVVETIIQNGGRAINVQGDVASDVEARHVYESTVGALGQITLLVNNASPRINAKPFLSTDWSDIQRHIDAQVKGAFLLSKMCLPDMISVRRGRIVNITSQVIEGPPSVTWTGYALAKTGLATLARYLAAEFGSHGVNVNCVSPGMTDTALIGDIPEKLQLMMARQNPLRRLAVPEDIASAVSFLASEEASYVTGHTLRVNGGGAMS